MWAFPRRIRAALSPEELVIWAIAKAVGAAVVLGSTGVKVDAAAHACLGGDVAWLVGFVGRVEFGHVGAVLVVACCCCGREKEGEREDTDGEHCIWNFVGGQVTQRRLCTKAACDTGDNILVTASRWQFSMARRLTRLVRRIDPQLELISRDLGAAGASSLLACLSN